MYSDLNAEQKQMVDSRGFVVVNAGPGSGKTASLVERFFALLEEGVQTSEVLLVTFTRNARFEMESRIRGEMIKRRPNDFTGCLNIVTFDSFCQSIVAENTTQLLTFFNGAHTDVSPKLTIIEDYTQNYSIFRNFLEGYLRGDKQKNNWYSIVALNKPVELFKLISKMLSKGVVPVKDGWFGLYSSYVSKGREESVGRARNALYYYEGGWNPRKSIKGIWAKDKDRHVFDHLPKGDGDLEESWDDPEVKVLSEFVHDVYFDYVVRCLQDGALTYEMNSLLALILLQIDGNVRSRFGFKHLMIDEFQDTNAVQLSMSMLLLDVKDPQLCVVGDGKQSIFGFRNTSPEFIENFHDRVQDICDYFRSNGLTMPSVPDEVTEITFVENYRSSESIINCCFNWYGNLPSDGSVGPQGCKSGMHAFNGDLLKEHSEVAFIRCPDKYNSDNDEASAVVYYLKKLMSDGKKVVDTGSGDLRPVEYKDIAVICEYNEQCRIVCNKLKCAGVPASIIGDQSVISTREGKLILAWLRFAYNRKDPFGYVPIMTDCGYSEASIKRVVASCGEAVPKNLLDMIDRFNIGKNGVQKFVSLMFDEYGIDNDHSQQILSILSNIECGSLTSIPELLSILDENIRNPDDARYRLEQWVDSDFVSVMTVHQAKGLEFPVTFIPYFDKGSNSFYTPPANSWYFFDEMIGLRCSKVITRDENGHKCMKDSGKTALIKYGAVNDNELYRKLFVALSRSKQYEYIIAKETTNPKSLFKSLSDGQTLLDFAYVRSENQTGGMKHAISEKPIIPPVRTRRMLRISVTKMLRSGEDSTMRPAHGGSLTPVEASIRGTMVHEDAARMFHGNRPKHDNPENDFVRSVIRGLKESTSDAYSEIECTLPVLFDSDEIREMIPHYRGEGPLHVTVFGIMDLMGVKDRGVVIHDYKTDSIPNEAEEYEHVMQLSVYAYAAMDFFGKDSASCFIDYVSQYRTKEITILPLDTIKRRLAEVLDGQYAEL